MLKITRSDELQHYGVPKMEWGKRRWQNKDGSLTPEGRIHYGIGQKRDKGSSEDNAEQRRRLAEEGRNKSHDAYYERTNVSNPKKYSNETYEQLKSGKYKDLAETLDRETAEKKKAAQDAAQKYIESGKYFLETKENKEKRQKAWDESTQANSDYWDEFFSISEKYIQDHFTKEQWDDARAFVYDHSALWW